MAVYEARKIEGSEEWQIYNTETTEVVDTGLTEETAKARETLLNKMSTEIEAGGDDDGGDF